MNVLLLFAVIVGLCILAAVAVRAIGGNITLVEHWKLAWRFYSTYALLLVAELPGIWNAVVSSGGVNVDEVPGEFAWATRAMAAVTAVLIYIKQADRPRPQRPDFNAGA